MFLQIPQGNIWASNSKQNKADRGECLWVKQVSLLWSPHGLLWVSVFSKCILVNPDLLLPSPGDFGIFEYHFYFTSVQALWCFLLTCNPCMWHRINTVWVKISGIKKTSKYKSFWTISFLRKTFMLCELKLIYNFLDTAKITESSLLFSSLLH